MGCFTNRIVGFGTLLVGVVCAQPVLASTIYEVGAGFSFTQNGGTNPWSYGYISSNDLNFANYTLFNTGNNLGGGSGGWTIGTNSDPNVFHNGGAASGANTNFYVAANAVILGPAFGPTVVQWTAPANGTVDLASSGQDIQSCCGSRTVYYDVFINGSDAGIGGPQNVGPNTGPTVDPNNLPTVTYNQSNIAVTAGEKIDFVAIGFDGSTWNSMQLNASIDFTPEPSSLAVVGLGALGLFGGRGRRKI